MGRHLKVPFDTKSGVGYASGLMSLYVVWTRHELWVAGVLFVIAVILVAHSIWDGFEDDPLAPPSRKKARRVQGESPGRWKDPGLSNFENRLNDRMEDRREKRNRSRRS